MCFYNPQFVYFKATFLRPKPFIWGSFFLKFWTYALLVLSVPGCIPAPKSTRTFLNRLIWLAVIFFNVKNSLHIHWSFIFIDASTHYIPEPIIIITVKPRFPRFASFQTVKASSACSIRIPESTTFLIFTFWLKLYISCAI